MDQTHLTEDAVSQSGWVFADLLVALSVIFLATISFVPTSNLPTGDTSLEPQKIAISNGFIGTYGANSIQELVEDLKQYRLEKSLGTGTSVILLQIIGSKENQTQDSGILDALRFSVELQNLDIAEFEDTEFSIDTSRLVNPGEITVRAVFGFKKNQN
jgi:hypothetical protein